MLSMRSNYGIDYPEKHLCVAETSLQGLCLKGKAF